MSEVKIPEGYKQTEVGVIPEDWEVKDLGSFMVFKNGLNKAKEFFGYGTPIVNYMDVYKSGSIQPYNIAGKVFVTSDEIRNYSAIKGDVFFTRTSETVEEIGLSSVLIDDIEDAVFSGFVLRARLKKKTLENSYMKYCFRSKSTRNQIQGTASYTTRALTNGKLLSNVLIPIPPKKEQTAIATALSDVDHLIQSLEKLIAKKEAIKTGTMQQLLTGKTRLPEFATREDGSAKGFKQTELGRIPEDWEVVRIIDNHIIATGNTPPTNDQRNYKGKFLFVSPADLGTNKLIHNTQKKLSLKGFKLARKFPKGSTLFTCIGSTIGKTGLATCELTSNQQINAVFPNEIDDFEFTYYALTHHSKRIKNKASEQAVPLINKTEFGQFEYMQPNELKEQTAIATILSDMDAEIQALQQRLDKTRDIKQGMMQQLLTGKVRLVD